MPATGALFAGAELQEALGRSEPPAAAGSVRPSARIYGLLTVFTLIDGAGEAFDRLAEETVEEVRRSEPDTLIFICHAVKSAPLQRIVYEIYRDEVAYTDHQRQPHMERFARERVAHVLAANVIELDLNAAKVVPLPTAYRA
jgi:quinol monooxygenase YgiN